MRLNWFIFLGMLLTFHISWGQIGEICSYKLDIDELENLEIYTLLMDQNEILYLGTDQGLYCYKSSSLHHFYPAVEQKGVSVFQLQSDEKGNIYCCNLSGQILKVNEDKLEIIYEVDQENIKSNFLFQTLPNGDFIYAAKNVVTVINGEAHEVISANTNLPGFEWFTLDRMYDNSFFLSSIGEEFGIVVSHDKVDTIELPFNFENKQYPVTHMFNRDDEAYFVTSDGRMAVPDHKFEEPRSIPAEKYYQINDSLVVAVDRTKGGRLLLLENGSIFETGDLLRNKFISTSYFDGRTLYLGTFNQGLYVCPNLNAIKHATIDNAIGIEVVNDMGFVISNTGEVYSYKDSLEQIDTSPINLDEIFYQKSVKELDSLLYNKSDFFGLGIIKDLWETDGGFFFTSNKGLYYLGTGYMDAVSDNWKSQSYEGFYVTNLGENHRYHSVASSEDVDNVIFSDPQGTYLLQDGMRIGELLKYKEEHFISNDLEWYDGFWICATAQDGILIFKDKDFVKQISAQNGLKSNSIHKVHRVEKNLYVQSTKGIQIIDLDEYHILNLGMKDGITSGIRDFDVEDDHLWILQNNDLLSIQLPSVEKPLPPPRLYIDSILIGGTLITDLKEERIFSHFQNSFSVFIDYRDLVSKESARIYYKLSGVDQDWRDDDAQINEILYSSLPPGEYLFSVKIEIDGIESEVMELAFTIDAPYYQKWWFYVMIVFIGAVMSWMIVKVYTNREKRKLKQQNELNASKLTAIQSQMNPHFIFNALNSIQDLVLKGDKKNSYTYITKFANLVRRTLNYSDKDLIEFSQEIKLIELYLTLEKLRFKTDFEYELNFPDTEVLVPPMLVQPFIENALVHGLLHKEGLRKLDITFELEDNLICTITDNGIGRKKATEIKNRQRGEEHESFSVNAIRKRFEILSEYYGGEFGYEYIDLEENGLVIGTKVILKLPAIRKY